MTTKAEADDLLKAWRYWQAVWQWANILIGGSAVGLGALVAANTAAKPPFLDPPWTIICAIVAPVLTFLLTQLKPQAESARFKAAARALEKGLNDKDPTRAVALGLEVLNRP